jgi:hypothetical protein
VVRPADAALLLLRLLLLLLWLWLLLLRLGALETFGHGRAVIKSATSTWALRQRLVLRRLLLMLLGRAIKEAAA